MEVGPSYNKRFADVSTSTGICSPESFFMKQHQDLFSGTNMAMPSNRNSVMTDDSGVFDDVISKSESFDSEFFEEQNKTLLSFPSPLAYNPAHPSIYNTTPQGKENYQGIQLSSSQDEGERELSPKEPEQMEACVNPLYLFDSNSEESPENASPEHSAINNNHMSTQSKTAEGAKQPERINPFSHGNVSPFSTDRKGSINSFEGRNDLASYERCCQTLSQLELASPAVSPIHPSRNMVTLDRNDNQLLPSLRQTNSTMSWCCDTTPTLPKKMGQSESACSSPYQKVASAASRLKFSSSSDSYSVQHPQRDNASTKSYPSKGSNQSYSTGTSHEGGSYLDFNCFSELDDCSSTLAYNEDGFYEDNPILLRTSGNTRRHSSDWACVSSSSTANNSSKQTCASSAAVRSKTGVNRRQSHFSPLNDRQTTTLYQKPHLYPKKYEAENLPEHQIYVELHQLQEMLKELQMKGTRIEQVLHCIAKEKGAKCRAEESALLAEWLELVRAKNRIVRRENQLMHMLSQKELEEIQEGITSKLRILMTKPGKTDVEASEEERLLSHLIQVVEKRNGIVQILEEERQNEEIEDQQCEDLLSPENLRDATTRQRTWRSVMSNFRNSKWSHRVKAYYGHNKL